MENTTAPASVSSSSKTTPKDFFLWLGAIVALYGSITSFIALKFQYIDFLFPDQLTSYIDPYGGPMRFAMAALIVLVPTMLILFWLIRGTIIKEEGKANVWVRRWALVFTLFLATATILIDLVTLINTFLGGEITVRFGLKVLVVLVVALIVFFYFFLDIRGYWVRNGKYARLVAAAVGVGAVALVIAGFFIVGSPTHVRALRLDDQRVNDLQNIQSQVTYYYQTKRALPKTLDALNDPLTNFIVPTDPESGTGYVYGVTDTFSFKLCATFTAASADTKNRVDLTQPVAPTGLLATTENWTHGIGETCFTRTIDPQKFPAVTSNPAVKGL